MKWFQHDCNMHTDFRVQELLKKHGADGYAVWNLCLEFLGRGGVKAPGRGRTWSLDGQTTEWWKTDLLNVLGWSDKARLDSILKTLADSKLLDSKSLARGNLSIPKFHELIDNWTRKSLRSDYVVTTELTTECIPYKDNIIEIRAYYTKLKAWKPGSLNRGDYARIYKACMRLFSREGVTTELIIEGLDWLAGRGWDYWTIETLDKHWAEFIKYKERGENVPAYMRDIVLPGEMPRKEQE